MNDNVVRVFDTTLRDGEQGGHPMRPDTKLRIAHALAEAGVDIIEAGFPESSPADAEAVQRIACDVKEVIICSLARAKKGAIEIAAHALSKAEKPRVHVFLATSDIHREKKLQMDKQEVLDCIGESVSYAKTFSPDIEFSPEDGSRTEPEFLADCIRVAISHGANTVNLPDTVGFTLPHLFAEKIHTLYASVPELASVTLSVHCHNDLSMAVANSLAGIRAGARQVEGCFLGIGERAGNAQLEAIIVALDKHKDSLGLRTKVDVKRLYPLCTLIAREIGFPIPMHHPIVGENVLAHGSGIHQDGVIKDPRTYEIFSANEIGWQGRSLRFTSRSGKKAIRHRLSELGYDGEKIASEIFSRFKEIADIKSELTDEDLHMLAQEFLAASDAVSAHLFYLRDEDIDYGPGFASVILRRNGKGICSVGRGVGAIDALSTAVNGALAEFGVDKPIKLTNFTVHKGIGGSDANAWVEVAARLGSHMGYGRSADPDTNKAAVRAYLSAINHALLMS